MSKRAILYIGIILCCLAISIILLLTIKKRQPEPSVNFPIPPLPMEEPAPESNVPGLFD